MAAPLYAQPEQQAEGVQGVPETELSTAEQPAADQPEANPSEQEQQSETEAAEQEQSGGVEVLAEEQPKITRPMAEPPTPTPTPSHSETGLPVAALSPYSSAWLAAAYISYNARDGYRKYEGIDGYQRLDNPGFFMFGGAAGKRFALRDPRLRVQAAAEVGWGSVFEGPIDLQEKNGGGEIIPGDLYENYLIGVVQGEIHYLFTFGGERSYFLSAGPGAHVSSYHETAKVENKKVLESDRLFMASLNFNVGAGMEYGVSDSRAVSISYNLRIWESLRFIETGELFPMGVDYREFFYTHMLRVQVLLPGLRYKRFY
jgi:hypothetical protein